MGVRLAESERVGLLLVAHVQHVQQCWVNGSHTHSMIYAELDKLEKELDHMHTEWARLTKENEKLALQLEETGNYGDIVYLKFIVTCPAEEHHSLQQKMDVVQKQFHNQEEELVQLR